MGSSELRFEHAAFPHFCPRSSIAEHRLPFLRYAIMLSIMQRTWTDDQLVVAVGDSISVAGVLRALGLTGNPGNYGTVRRHAARLHLSLEHFKGQAHGRSRSPATRPLEDWLTTNTYVTGSLKKRVLRAGLLPMLCAQCGLGDVWCGMKLVLQLDHVNGDTTDNRLVNLRLLCPNCHTQTPTFSCRRSRIKKPSKTCACGKAIVWESTYCKKCSWQAQVQKRKGDLHGGEQKELARREGKVPSLG